MLIIGTNGSKRGLLICCCNLSDLFFNLVQLWFFCASRTLEFRVLISVQFSVQRMKFFLPILSLQGLHLKQIPCFSEEEARQKIYSVSTRHYFAFGALVSEELSYKLKGILISLGSKSLLNTIKCVLGILCLLTICRNAQGPLGSS